MKYKSTALMVFVACSLAGCGTRGMLSNSFNGEPMINDPVWLRTAPNTPLPKDHFDSHDQNDPMSIDYLPPVCRSAPTSNASVDPYAGWNRSQIEICTRAMIGLIDLRWAHYADALGASSSTWTTAADLTEIGLSTASGLLGHTTGKVLAATSAALAGAQGKVDADVLYSHSINLILQQMQTNRAAELILIQAKLDNHKYQDGDMYEAATDLYAYARAGSWTEALLGLETSSGSKAQDCKTQQKLNALNDALGKTVTSEKDTTSGASSVCPSTTPPQPISLNDKSSVSKLQSALVGAGYDPKGVDGKWGKNTQKALDLFQASKGLPQTPLKASVLDTATASALGL